MRLRYVMLLIWIDWCGNSSEVGKIRLWNEPSDWVPWKQIAKWGAYPNSAISHPQCFFYCWIWSGLFRQQSLITWYWTVNVVLIATSLRISKQNPRQVACISSIEMLNNNSFTWQACFDFFFFLEKCWFHQQEGMDRPLIYVRPLAPFQKNWFLGFEVFVPASSLTSFVKFMYFIITFPYRFCITVSILFLFYFFLVQQSQASANDTMTGVLKLLQRLNVRWKKIGDYNMKCLWLPPCYTPTKDPTTSIHVYGPIINRVSSWSPNAIKFEFQVTESSFPWIPSYYKY